MIRYLACALAANFKTNHDWLPKNSTFSSSSSFSSAVKPDRSFAMQIWMWGARPSASKVNSNAVRIEIRRETRPCFPCPVSSINAVLQQYFQYA